MSDTSSQQKKILDLSVSAARAISGEPKLNYRGNRLYRGEHLFYFLSSHTNDLTFLSRHELTKNKLAIQGKLDSAALRILFSDFQLHLTKRPDNEVERLIFDFCEQVRAESMTPPYFKGVLNSTQFNFAYWSRHYQQNGFTESRLGMLLFTLMQVIYSRLTGIPIAEPIAETIESTRAGIAPIIGHCLKTLKEQRLSQNDFATHANELGQIVRSLVASEEQNSEGLSSYVEEDIKILAQIALIVDGEIEDLEISADVTGESKTFQDTGSEYRIYTREFDQTLSAHSLVRDELLKELRQKLTDDMMARRINTRHLAVLLSNTLKTQERIQRQNNLEEGIIDSSTITRIITSPLDRNIFFQTKLGSSCQTAITFLIDCSGSMQKHSHKLSLLMDTLLKSVGLAGIPCEILGFTTGNWNGGRVYRKWLKHGQPSHPGRLNEVRHIIFKDFNTHWRRARLNIAALRKADIFKEGIDGEAIQFANQRLIQQNVQRKILIVFSDGCPMDTATSTANDPFYLDNHLKQVIDRDCFALGIEIYGVGMGVDLSPYYHKNITLDPQESCIFSSCRALFTMLKK